MKKPKNNPCRKRNGKQVSFEFKLSVIEQINNGRISINYAAKKYNLSRSTIYYWMEKLSNYDSKTIRMNKDKEIKKLQERIEALEFIKEFQQDMIIEFEKVTGEEFSKKFLPEHLTNEIQRKKKSLLK
jgi:transposase-like protein